MKLTELLVGLLLFGIGVFLVIFSINWGLGETIMVSLINGVKALVVVVGMFFVMLGGMTLLYVLEEK